MKSIKESKELFEGMLRVSNLSFAVENTAEQTVKITHRRMNEAVRAELIAGFEQALISGEADGLRDDAYTALYFHDYVTLLLDKKIHPMAGPMMERVYKL